MQESLLVVWVCIVICRFTSHGSKNARCLPKSGSHREACLHVNCKLCPAICKAYFQLRENSALGSQNPVLDKIDALLTLTGLSSLGDESVLQFGISLVSISIIQQLVS